MDNKKDIMQFSPVLPADFDGTFRFTNWTDEDFIGKWGGKEYRFPAGTTSPIVIHDQTPLEIQQIRKKFAKNLAEREFGKTAAYTRLIAQERNPDGSPRLNSMMQAGQYSVNDLSALIQRCLDPLPAGKVEVSEAPKKDIEEALSRNEDGTPNTIAIDKKISLKKKALES